jgi:UrcA family protein
MKTMTLSIRVRALIATAMFGAAAGMTALPAAADGTVGAAQTTVKFSDLNLSTSQGAAALYARIKTAAKSVCPGAEDRDLGVRSRSGACIERAVQTAVVEVNAPALSALYSQSTGKVVPTRLAAR